MASILGSISSCFLRQRKCLYKRFINKIQRFATSEICEQIDGLEQPNVVEQHKVVEPHSEIMVTVAQLFETNDPQQDLCFHVRNEMIKKHLISEQNVDTRIMDICLKERKEEIAKAYLKYLQSSGHSLSIYTLGRYLELYHFSKPTSSFEENEIINICEKIQKEFDYIPDIILKNCIIALCKTHKWRSTLDMVQISPNSNLIKSLIEKCIIPAALRNKDITLALKLFNEIFDPEYGCHKNFHMYEEYLNYYLQNEPKELNEAIERIFIFWRKYDIVPIQSIVELFVNVCKNAGWKVKYVTIKQNGNCYCCGNYLSDNTTCNKSFKRLADDVINKTVIAKDIFQNTTPQELQKFLSFVHKLKPFDFVIDGLNIIYSSRNTGALWQVVKYFAKGDKKILIIGRKHLHRLPKLVNSLPNIHFFLLDNITNDDPFVLYAALISGSNAKFVTIDNLRQHVHKLDSSKSRRKFKRWQYTHQYICQYNQITNKITITEPWLFEPFTQCNNGTWHVPYRMNSEGRKLLRRPVDTWICFRKLQN